MKISCALATNVEMQHIEQETHSHDMKLASNQPDTVRDELKQQLMFFLRSLFPTQSCQHSPSSNNSQPLTKTGREPGQPVALGWLRVNAT